MGGSAAAVALLPFGAAGADGRCCWLFARWRAPGRIAGVLRPFAGLVGIAATDPLTAIGALGACAAAWLCSCSLGGMSPSAVSQFWFASWSRATRPRRTFSRI